MCLHKHHLFTARADAKQPLLQVLVVRKYRTKPYGQLDVDSRLENEVRIASALEEKMRNIKGPKPLMAEMIQSHDIKPADVNFWTRVSFWKYYNLGDFDKFFFRYPATAADPAVLPIAIFARFLNQVNKHPAGNYLTGWS